MNKRRISLMLVLSMILTGNPIANPEGVFGKTATVKLNKKTLKLSVGKKAKLTVKNAKKKSSKK